MLKNAQLPSLSLALLLSYQALSMTLWENLLAYVGSSLLTSLCAVSRFTYIFEHWKGIYSRPSNICYCRTIMQYSAEQNHLQRPRYAIVPAPYITQASDALSAIKKYNSLPEHERYPEHRVKFVLPLDLNRRSNIQEGDRVKHKDRDNGTY